MSNLNDIYKPEVPDEDYARILNDMEATELSEFIHYLTPKETEAYCMATVQGDDCETGRLASIGLYRLVQDYYNSEQS